MSSIAWVIPSTGLPVYVTAKAGVVGLTRTLAHELGRDNIRVNSVLPGAILTERQRRLWLTEEYLAEVLARQVIKRLILPEEVARLVLFLAADDSSAIRSSELRYRWRMGLGARQEKPLPPLGKTADSTWRGPPRKPIADHTGDGFEAKRSLVDVPPALFIGPITPHSIPQADGEKHPAHLEQRTPMDLPQTEEQSKQNDARVHQDRQHGPQHALATEAPPHASERPS